MDLPPAGRELGGLYRRGAVPAQDFVDALAYLLDPDYASGTASLVTPYVAGAEDYYNYCVWRNNANNGTVAEDGTTYTIDAAGTVTLTRWKPTAR